MSLEAAIAELTAVMKKHVEQMDIVTGKVAAANAKAAPKADPKPAPKAEEPEVEAEEPEEKPKATRGRPKGTAKPKAVSAKALKELADDFVDVEEDAEYEARVEFCKTAVAGLGVAKMNELEAPERITMKAAIEAYLEEGDRDFDVEAWLEDNAPEAEEKPKPRRRADV